MTADLPDPVMYDQRSGLQPKVGALFQDGDPAPQFTVTGGTHHDLCLGKGRAEIIYLVGGFKFIAIDKDGHLSLDQAFHQFAHGEGAQRVILRFGNHPHRRDIGLLHPVKQFFR